MGLEIAQQIAAIGTRWMLSFAVAVVGGLIAGLGIAVHAHNPKPLFGALNPNFMMIPNGHLETGSIQRADTDKSSICDAIVTPEPGTLTFPINRQHLSGGAVISDDQALRAVATLFKHLKNRC